MLRFPNPGSDIGTLVRAFQAIFKMLRAQENFTLDDISRALVASNLATSSGYMGAEALKRSTRADRSRDPLFNQSKMYSELYRILGWIHPATNDKQRFTFTYLGAHVGLDRDIPTRLVRECLLGIAYPNPLVEVRASTKLRPIAQLLLTAEALESRLTRDEMILGPLDLGDDRDREQVQHMLNSLRTIRGNPGRAIPELRRRARALQVQVNTLRNYTRFPIGVLRWAGWTRPERGAAVLDVLTEAGSRIAGQLRTTVDVRAADLQNAPEEEVGAFIRLAVYRMLERAGYVLGGDVEPLHGLEGRCASILRRSNIDDTRRILFSPFQEMEPSRLASVFPPHVEEGIVAPPGHKISAGAEPAVENIARRERIVLSRLKKTEPKRPKGEEVLALIVDEGRRVGGDVMRTVEAVFERYRGATKERFYPAVAALFRCLGFRCTHSRAGVHYQRMDALIEDEMESVPIEIKSPAEEEYLSLKAVRQALENKIVLMARRHAPTRRETTTLVVGYEPPNDRSEVGALIENIHVAYGISVGVMDFRSLLHLAASRLLKGRGPTREAVLRLRGFAEVENS